MRSGTTYHRLEKLYRKYTHRQYVHPDPLEFLYDYPDVRDREIVGLIASSLAYGRVVQILKSVRRVLDTLGASPYRLLSGDPRKIPVRKLRGFKHRFATGDEMIALLKAAGRVIKKHGSLNQCFLQEFSDGDANVIPALEAFAHELGGGQSHLMPCAARGSACKRLNLFLRWMVREDEVDPGGWVGISPAKLVIPLDAHMFRFGKTLGFTERKTADLTTALEVTAGFRAISPHDPVKYDFALTRLGINNLPGLDEILSES